MLRPHTRAKNRKGGLTPKQRAFCDRYLEIGNASEAYRRSYGAECMSDHAIRTEASRLLRHPDIALRISQFHEKAEAQTLLTLEQHMEELRVLRDCAKKKSQLAAAIKAEELRGRLRGFYVEKVEHGGTNEFDGMTEDELRQFIAGETKALELQVVEPLRLTSKNR